MTTALPTREDYFQVGAAEVFARSAQRPKATRISPEAVFTPGTDINIIIAACSAMADEATRHMAIRMAALYLDSAEGEDLDRLVQDRFSPTVVRKQAAPSVVPLEVRRTVPGPAVSLSVGTVVRTETGIQFKLVQAAALALNSTGPVTVAAQAIQAGSVGNVQAGTITQFVQSPPDPTMTITNPQPASGGSDVETDESLRERARQFYLTARRATLSAIEFGALTVEGVTSASAIEVTDPMTGLPTGHVLLYIADQNGQSNQILVQAVRNALLEWRAAGIVVDVLATAPQFEQVQYSIAFRSGVDTLAATEQLRALTVAAVNLLQPGEPLQRSLLFALARSIPGAIVSDSAVVVPAGDIVPDAARTIKTQLGLVLINGT